MRTARKSRNLWGIFRIQKFWQFSHEQTYLLGKFSHLKISILLRIKTSGKSLQTTLFNQRQDQTHRAVPHWPHGSQNPASSPVNSFAAIPSGVLQTCQDLANTYPKCLRCGNSLCKVLCPASQLQGPVCPFSNAHLVLMLFSTAVIFYNERIWDTQLEDEFNRQLSLVSVTHPVKISGSKTWRAHFQLRGSSASPAQEAFTAVEVPATSPWCCSRRGTALLGEEKVFLQNLDGAPTPELLI